MRRFLSPALLALLLTQPACSNKSSSSDVTSDLGNEVLAEIMADVPAVPDLQDSTAELIPDSAVVELPDSTTADATEVQTETQASDADTVTEPSGPLPFSPGPYGTQQGDTAGPFVLPTTTGDFDFQKRWSGGNDSYIFALYVDGYDYVSQLWNSSAADLLKKSPLNVHYFFMTYQEDAASVIEAQETRIRAEIETLSDAQKLHWPDRVHFVTTRPQDLGNWITDVLSEHGYVAFSIDRFQHLREVGMLLEFPGDETAKLKFLRHEAEYFNYEWDRDTRLQAEENVTLVPLFDEAFFANNQYVEVEFPDAAVMAGFDTLELDTTMACETASDESCGEWDYLADLYLCSLDEPETCTIEVARFITTYGRPAHWVTDISSMLPLFKDGGTFRFRMNNSWQSYRLTQTLRLSNRGKGLVPAEIQPLWMEGGWFNLDYNPAHPPIKVQLPEDAKKVEIVAYITGHGFAWDQANCAEFCKHQHYFGINGDEYSKLHPEAGIMTGCLARVPEGVVPNQYGTWPLGRGGWCPGLDVAPWVADITPSVVPGENEISYRALYFGKEYDPEPTGDESATPGNIRLSSYLVIWK